MPNNSSRPGSSTLEKYIAYDLLKTSIADDRVKKTMAMFSAEVEKAEIRGASIAAKSIKPRVRARNDN